MNFEDPRFLVFGVAMGVGCALMQAPLAVAVLVGAGIGVAIVPPFVLSKATGFWGAYTRQQWQVLFSILADRSNISFQMAWVVVTALVLLGMAAVLFGLGMAEFALPKYLNISVADRQPMLTAVTMLCVYLLFGCLKWWAARHQSKMPHQKAGHFK